MAEACGIIFLLGKTFEAVRAGDHKGRPTGWRGPDPTVTVDDLWLTLPQQASLIYQASQNENAEVSPCPLGVRMGSLGNRPLG